ncbi:glycosyltransferase family 4 protein, partial [Patescibacteria group bacterium]|nr:glycosyltransferase family 4 protein [Patescibacteria group bacterium]
WYLRQEATNSDVVISSMFPLNVLANRLSDKTIQLCYEPFAFFHDPNFIAGLSSLRKLFVKIIKPFYNNLDKNQTIKSTKVLTLSNFNKKWIAKVYGRKDVNVVYEGVNTDFFKPVKVNFLKSKYKDRKIVFHSTDFTGIKGTSFLIKALPYIVKEIPKLLLLISYTIDNKEEKERMELLAKELRVTKNIKYLGFVKYDDLPLYAGLAEIAVQPSIMQSMSMSVKEAMACETPVITSPEGKEQFKDGEAGFLVDPKNETKLAEKVIELLSNKSLRMDMGKRGRKIVIDKFSWESVAERFYTNIRKVANE